MIWSPVCELPYGPRSFIAASSEAGQMAASDYVPNFLKNHLHLAGRPQMLARKPRMLVAVALANKMARIVWALLVKHGVYRAPVAASA